MTGSTEATAASPGPPAPPPVASLDAAPPRPARSNVYDPEAEDEPAHPAVVVLLAVVATVLVGLIVTGLVLDDGEPGAGVGGVGPIDLGATAEDRSTGDLGDGWWHLDLDDGTVAVDLPGPLLRTRDAFEVDGEAEPAPAAAWVGGHGTSDVYGVIVVEPPEGWDRDPEDLLDDVVVTIGDERIDGEGIRTEVAGRPTLRRWQGGGGHTTVTTSVAIDDALVVLVLRSEAALAEPTLERMEASLALR